MKSMDLIQNPFSLAMNHPAEAFRTRNASATYLLVPLTILAVVFGPLLGFFTQADDLPWTFSVVEAILLRLPAAVATYLAAGTAFWLIGRMLGGGTPWRVHVRLWGVTYLPTLLCAVLTGVAEAWFWLFWNQAWLGVVLGVAFSGILIWKTLLYVLYLRHVTGLAGTRLAVAFAVGAIPILMLAMADLRFGLRVPIL